MKPSYVGTAHGILRDTKNLTSLSAESRVTLALEMAYRDGAIDALEWAAKTGRFPGMSPFEAIDLIQRRLNELKEDS